MHQIPRKSSCFLNDFNAKNGAITRSGVPQIIRYTNGRNEILLVELPSACSITDLKMSEPVRQLIKGKTKNIEIPINKIGSNGFIALDNDFSDMNL